MERNRTTEILGYEVMRCNKYQRSGGDVSLIVPILLHHTISQVVRSSGESQASRTASIMKQSRLCATISAERVTEQCVRILMSRYCAIDTKAKVLTVFR
jgi:hypothetical protein